MRMMMTMMMMMRILTYWMILMVSMESLLVQGHEGNHFISTTSRRVFPCQCYFVSWGVVQLDWKNTCYNTDFCFNKQCNSYYSGPHCQTGRISRGKVATQTGTSNDTDTAAAKAIDDDETQTSCSVAEREDGRLYWQVNLQDPHVVSGFQIKTHDDHRYTLQGAKVYISSDNNTEYNEDTDTLCHEFLSGIVVPDTFSKTCSEPVVGQYITIVNDQQSEMHLCLVDIQGYFHYICEYNSATTPTTFYYGPACARNCWCSEQCDLISGSCPGACLYATTPDADGVCTPCGANTWGQDCLDRCYCNTGTCDTKTGICPLCASGYVGTNCNINRNFLAAAELAVTINNQNIRVDMPPQDPANMILNYTVSYRSLGHPHMLANDTDWNKLILQQNVSIAFIKFRIPEDNFYMNSEYELKVQPYFFSEQFSGAGTESQIVAFKTKCAEEDVGFGGCHDWCRCGSSINDLCLRGSRRSCNIGCHVDSNITAPDPCLTRFPEMDQHQLLASDISNEFVILEVQVPEVLPDTMYGYIIRYSIAGDEYGYSLVKQWAAGKTSDIRISALQPGTLYFFTLSSVIQYNDQRHESRPIANIEVETTVGSQGKLVGAKKFTTALAVAITFGIVILCAVIASIIYVLKCRKTNEKKTHDDNMSAEYESYGAPLEIYEGEETDSKPSTRIHTAIPLPKQANDRLRSTPSKDMQSKYYNGDMGNAQDNPYIEYDDATAKEPGHTKSLEARRPLPNKPVLPRKPGTSK